MANKYDAIAKQAAELTNKQLAGEMASLSRWSAEELDQLLPRKTDKTEFLELMKLVQKETDEDKAAVKLATDIGRFGKTVVKVLKFFA